MSPAPQRPPAVHLPLRRRSAADALSGIRSITLASALMAGLYFGRDVLIPLSLAALITFLLSPLVSLLERWLGKIAAVLLAMSLLLGGAVTLGWAVGSQAVDLAYELPGYKENIRAKLQSFQVPEGGAFDQLEEAMDDLKKDLPGNGEDAKDVLGTSRGEAEPIPVEVVEDATDGPVEILRSVAGPVLGPLGTAALVFLLATFMLLKRDDLQGRIIRLIGQGRISATTRAMDEAGTRVRRYLLMQLVVNVTYGIPLAIGLYFIGVPNALLWGALAAGLRFIPYIGPWIAAVFPILLSLAVSPSWTTPLLTLGLFVVLELLSNNVLEPWLYGTSTGVSSIALIVAAVFWTWMWGPVGLVMATPITVCLVVMGRHIPQLSFLSVVLGEEEALTPAEDFYHRLLKQGEHDETELAESILKTKSLVELYDGILIPVLIAGEEDHRLGAIDADQRVRIVKALGDLVEDLGERHLPPVDEAGASFQAACRVRCIAARAERDEIAGAMTAHVLLQQGYDAAVIPGVRITGELIGTLERDPADLVCISVVEPSKALHARSLCQRLRRALPDQRMVVGLWGRVDEIVEEVQLLRDAGVDEVFTSIPELVAYVDRLASNLTEQTESPARPADEEERLLSLTRLGLANGEREPVLDRVTVKVARVFEVPVAAITLIDRDRQWFKAHTGLPEDLAAEGTMLRDLSICAHVIAENGPVLVKDLKRDRRFGKSELLLKHGIRFYAGVPIHAPDGQPVGALCVMDLTPRAFTKRDLRMLEEKAADVTEELGRLADVTPTP